ncbi:TRAP transporter substrate-binding protein [Chelativorans intermedius]|uniref:TRAP transporter substrate-binding protein n=1 Tax=Chelativorans intermedius TaxID=515947 RepID=A0ABV6D9F0_9HYPH|nr:TRAP transporter substrate-binding protein [Chelativorans intermedius]MCT9000016.1 TRAP transporter substrate-binding protein [Chelativorans intermedius]
MKALRKAALAAAATLVVAGLSFEASAETWRMAHKMPADSVEGRVFQAFADRIAEKTDGAITVQVYPNEQLGKDDAILEQLQMGTVHIYPEGSSYLQKWVPEMQFVSAPFLFDDREHWARFMASDLVKDWHERIETEAGITVIGDPTAMVRGPYRVMVVKKPVASLEDIQGLKLRLHPDELAAAAWRHLGAEVRTLAWTEVYESLGRGIVEAVNSPIALVEPMRFYEVAPHVVRHDEYPQGLAFMANAAAWNALDEETRAQVLEAYDEVAAESAAETLNAANESIERMKKEGVTFLQLDTAPVVERMQQLYEQMRENGELPEGFLETVAETRQIDG